MFCVSVCPVVPLLLAKDFERDYLQEENPRVSEMSNEFMELKLHITHLFIFFFFFLFACGGLVYFHCFFAIARFLIFQEQQTALHRSWRSGQVCSGSLCFHGRDVAKPETTLLPGMFRCATHNSEEKKSCREWHDTNILIHFHSFLSSFAHCSFHHYLWRNKRAFPLTTTPKRHWWEGLRKATQGREVVKT